MARKSTKKVENPKEVRLPLTETTTVVVAVKEFKGVHRVDVREYVDTESYTGFTKKGVSMRVEELDNLINALQVIKATIVAEGICNEDEEEAEEA